MQGVGLLVRSLDQHLCVKDDDQRRDDDQRGNDQHVCVKDDDQRGSPSGQTLSVEKLTGVEGPSPYY